MGTEPSEQCGSRFSTKCRVNKKLISFPGDSRGSRKKQESGINRDWFLISLRINEFMIYTIFKKSTQQKKHKNTAD